MSPLLYVAVSDRADHAGAVPVESWHVATTWGPARCGDTLSQAELARCQSVTSPAASALHVSAYAFRREVLARRAGAPPAAIAFPQTYRTPLACGAFASLSHTHGAVAVACAARAVGIDIETAARGGDPVRLAARYFAPDEYAALARLAPAEAACAFSRRWTAKEALMKAAGCTLREALATSIGADAPLPFTRTILGAAITVFAPAPGFVCAVALA